MPFFRCGDSWRPCWRPDSRACNAGACATIFDADYVLPHPVEAAPDGSTLNPWQGAALSLGNEIDKLANNIALGRDAAAVHYRSDSVRGLFVGEQQALGLLQDYTTGALTTSASMVSS
jgi:hypothetical protein